MIGSMISLRTKRTSDYVNGKIMCDNLVIVFIHFYEERLKFSAEVVF